MNWKDFREKGIIGFILKNILAALALIAVFIWITFWAIDKYTGHGIVERVPDLRDAYMEEAEILLAAQGLYPEIIDSVYVRDKRLGTVVEQTPQPNSTIKRNRPVYLIINSREIRQVALPQVTDFSSRQAGTMLKASKLNVGSIEYAPSEYKDLVIDIKYKGKSVQPGTKIPEGESVVLIVGQGLGTEGAVIPKLKNMTLEEARYEILSSAFILGATYYDENSGEGEYLVYNQDPVDGKIVPSGTKINVWLTADTLLLKQNEHRETYTENEDEEFF